MSLETSRYIVGRDEIALDRICRSTLIDGASKISHMRHHNDLRTPFRGVGAFLLVTVCGWCAAQPAGSISLRTENLHGVDVHIQYPVVVGAEATALNLIIQRWIGGSCNESPVIRNTYMARMTYRGPKDCLTALSRECAALQTGAASVALAMGPCEAQITAKPELDTDGLLVISLFNFGFAARGFLGIPNESEHTEYLNLDIATGRILNLSDLLKPSYRAPLQRMIVRSLRAQSHVAGGEPLTQAGFLTNDPPIPATMEILRAGLKFSYRAGEITTGRSAPPNVVVSYEELSSLIPADSPLRRLLDRSMNLH